MATAGDQRGQERPHGADAAEQIDLEHQVVRRGVALEQRAARRDAGVGDDHVDPTEVLDDLGGDARQGGSVRRGTGLDADLFARSVFTPAEGAARLLLADPDRWSVGHFTTFCREVLAAMRPAPRTTPLQRG